MYHPTAHHKTSPAAASASVAATSAFATVDAHACAGFNVLGLTAMVAIGLAVLFLATMSAYTYWRIASGRDVLPVRKERPWSWRYDPESNQIVPLEPVPWPTWGVDETYRPTGLRRPPPAQYNPLAEINAKCAAPPPPTIALFTSTSFHTNESLEDLRDGIYDTRRRSEHEHVCSSDLRNPGPARKNAPTIAVVAPAGRRQN